MNKTFTISCCSVLLLASQGLAAVAPQNPFTGVAPADSDRFKNVNIVRQERNPEAAVLNTRACPVTPVITEVSGDVKEYVKTSEGLYVFEDVEYYEESFGTQIVFGDNNEVYFYNFFSKRQTNSYVKGTKNGNKITIDLPQTIAYYDNLSYGMNLAVIKGDFFEMGGQMYVEYNWDPSITQISFSIDGEGRISLDPVGSGYDGYTMPEYALGMIYTDDESWFGYADFTQVYTPDEIKINQIPDGVEMETYSFVYGSEGNLIKVGIDGDQVYFQGLSEMLPEGVVVGTLGANNIVTITQNQNTGRLGAYNIYTKVVYVNPDFVENDPANPYYILAPENAVYQLSYNPETKQFISVDKDIYLCLNGLLDALLNLGLYHDIYMTPFTDYNGIPANPYGLEYNPDSVYRYGYYSFYFYSPVYTSDKTLLQQDDLYFRIYIDGELMQFEETFGFDLLGYEDYKYAGIMTPTSEISVSFDNQWDIVVWSDGMHEIGFYEGDMQTIGVDIVYKYDGKTTYSDIMTLDIQSGEVTGGIENILGAEPQKVEYFNLNGIKVTNPEKGIYLQKQILPSGKTITKKVIR